MIITATPLRISFFGGAADYPEWYRGHARSVLSTTINKCCYVSCRFLPPLFECRSIISYSQLENVFSNDDIQNPSVRACLRYLGIEEGIEIHHMADLPARTGLGNSSALTVGLLHALYALKNQMRDKHSLAHEAIHIEQNMLENKASIHDQLAVSYGGFNRINVATDDSVEVRRVMAPQLRITELQERCMLFFTGFPNTASEIAQERVHVTDQKEHELSTMFQMVDEAESIVTSSQRPLNDFGRLLRESWDLNRSLTNKTSNPYIDAIYGAGLRAGALGGKLLGTGNGGFMLFYVPPECQQAVRESLKDLLFVPFSFMNRGTHVLLYEPEEMYDGALANQRDPRYSYLPAPITADATATGFALAR